MLAGEPQSFDDSFAALFTASYGAAYRVLGDAYGSEDVAAEVLFRISLRWQRTRAHALPWVVRVSTNLAIDEFRRRQRRSGLGRRSNDHDHDLECGEPDRSALYDAIDRLPVRQREVVTLRYFGDLSEYEIARELGIAPGSVKSHSSRALATLRQALASLQTEPRRVHNEG